MPTDDERLRGEAAIKAALRRASQATSHCNSYDLTHATCGHSVYTLMPDDLSQNPRLGSIPETSYLVTLQQRKCLNGEHEALQAVTLYGPVPPLTGNGTFNSYTMHLCCHCRSLYVEKS